MVKLSAYAVGVLKGAAEQPGYRFAFVRALDGWAQTPSGEPCYDPEGCMEIQTGFDELVGNGFIHELVPNGGMFELTPKGTKYAQTM